MRKLKKLKKQFIEWAKSHKLPYIIIMFFVVILLEILLLVISDIFSFNLWIKIPFVFIPVLAACFRIFNMDLDFILSAPKNYKDIKRI